MTKANELFNERLRRQARGEAPEEGLARADASIAELQAALAELRATRAELLAAAEEGR